MLPVDAARGATALEAIGILPGFSGVSVHDGWTSYRHFHTARHALCNAHHLRELTFVHEELQPEWAGNLKALLRDMRTAVEQARSAGATRLERSVRDDYIARYEALLGDGLAHNPLPPPVGPPPVGPPPVGPPRGVGASRVRRKQSPAQAESGASRVRRKQSPARNLLDRLWIYQHEALRFLDDFAVPFDNNQAERDLRMVKVQHKIAGSFRADAGSEAFARIRG